MFDRQTNSSLNVLSVLQLVISLLTVLQDQTFKHTNALKFVCEQLFLMTLDKFAYSPDLLVFSSLLHSFSPTTYRFIRDKGFLILPCHETIRRVFISKQLSPEFEQHDSNFLSYIKQKFKALSDADKTVILMMDEIHLKPYFDFKGGNIVGSAFDRTEAATSAYAFMLNSILSKYRDVVHLIPVKSIKAETLHNLLKKVIIGLEHIGFNVICVVSDNNRINGKAMSFFSNPPNLTIEYPHPADCNKPLFFLFDSVHILKCIRNNWLGHIEKGSKTMRFPKFSSDGSHNVDNILFAPWTALNELHRVEADLLLKFSYKLSMKALRPSSFEKQNVNLVLKIFNDYVIQAMLHIGNKMNSTAHNSVAAFIQIVLNWWSILNVKSTNKGIRLNNKFCTPLTSNEDDTKYIFLKNFCSWLDIWNQIPGEGGKLSKETFSAIKHTTHAIIRITKYCRDELKMKFILPGKFQTDHLESRFSQYRQLAGGNYNISVRQMFECEKKIRKMSVINMVLPLHDKKVILKHFEEPLWDKMECNGLSEGFEVYINIKNSDIKLCENVLPVIVYLAGYCCYAVNKKMKCKACFEIITRTDCDDKSPQSYDYINGISRGSLCSPNEISVGIVQYNYIIINKLTQNVSFKNTGNQRLLAMNITRNALTTDEVAFPVDYCEDGHSLEKVMHMIVWASTNSLLNNFCSKENDHLTINKCNASEGKKRKLQTVTK